MSSFLSIGSTLAQAFVILLGGAVMVYYSVTVLRRALREWGPMKSVKDLVNRMTYLAVHLSLVGLYGLFVYFVTAEEMSDPGFQALAQMFGSGL